MAQAALESAAITQREFAKTLRMANPRWIERTLSMTAIPHERVRRIAYYVRASGRFTAQDHKLALRFLMNIRITKLSENRLRERSPGNPVPIFMPRMAVAWLVQALHEFLTSQGVEAPGRAVLTRFFERSIHPLRNDTYRDNCVALFILFARGAARGRFGQFTVPNESAGFSEIADMVGALQHSLGNDDSVEEELLYSNR